MLFRSEKVMAEISGPDGGAIKTESIAKIDTRDLDEDQRAALKAALQAVVDSGGR